MLSGWAPWALAGLLVLAMAAGGAEPVKVFVSPAGRDDWSGRLAAPNAAATDGPVASLTGARDAVRKSRAQGGVGLVTVEVAGGVYRIEEPLRFAPQDGGTADAPVVYQAAAGARPVISGGRAITGWRKGDGPIWTAPVPGVREGQWYFHQLWVNGRRAVRARTPNTGWLRTAGQLPGFENPHEHRGKREAGLGFRYREGDLNAWPDLADAGIVLYHSWTNSVHWIKSLDEAQRLVTFSNRSGWPVGWWEANNQRYHVENILSALDEPGEWYLERSTGLLHYWPREGEDLTTAEVTAPVATQLLALTGDARIGLPVAHLTFAGLSFQHTDWQYPRETELDGQAATFLSGAVQANGAVDCRFEDVEVAHVGSYGVWLERGCKDNRLDRCLIWDLAGGGVRIGEGTTRSEAELTERNTVDNCFIHHGGEVFTGACGVLIQRSSHNTIRHCEISDFNYTGISVGWSWGYQDSSANHNVIDSNHVHHLGWGQMSDMGGIYTLGISPGTRVVNNVFHDILSYSYGGWGLYTDEGSSEILFENNLVYNTKTGGFHQHYGRDNVVRNNILAFSAEGQVQRSRQEEHNSFTFERNVVVFSQGSLLSGGWSNDKFVIDRNLYWRTDGEELDFAGADLEDWRARGHDGHSVIQDPGFADLARRDFTLPSGSPADQVGFKPFDFRQAGLYGDAEWVALPRSLQRPAMAFAAPPPPFAIDDGFEDTDVGQPPRMARVGNFEPAASIAVTDELAATGQRSLKIVDAPGLKHEWNPHFFYQPRYYKGIAEVSFAIRLGPGAKLYHEWRDASSPYKVGPSLQFEPDGRLMVGGQELLRLPAEQWLRLAIRYPLGKQTPGTWRLEVTVPGQDPKVFDALPTTGRPRTLDWLGWSSTATDARVFLLDDIHVAVVKE